MIPDSVKTVGDDLFVTCLSLSDISIPGSIESLGESTFHNCAGLIELNLPEGLTRIEDGMFVGCSNLEVVHVPSTVSYFGDRVFSYCRKLAKINIPNGVTYIGEYAFEECYSLKKIIVPDGVTLIEPFVFHRCISLEYLSLPEGITRIGNKAISLCERLSQLSIPSSVEFLEALSFEDNSNLKAIYFTGSAPATDEESPFRNNHEDLTLYHFDGEGFTSPTWEGLPIQSIGILSPSVAWLVNSGYNHETELGSDPEGAGYPLLIDYASNSERGHFRLPQPLIFEGQMGLVFYGARDDLTYMVEQSYDLLNWTSNGVNLFEPNQDGMRTASLSVSNGPLFVRFRFFTE